MNWPFFNSPSKTVRPGNLSPSTGSGSVVLGTSPTITTPNIVGTSTNDNAAAGSVGELLTNQAASPGSGITTGNTTNVVQLSLTAGDWDVQGVAGFVAAAGTSITYYLSGISTVSATIGAQDTFQEKNQSADVPGGGFTQLTPTVRISLAATTTIYLIAYTIFSVSTMTAYGNLRARRVR